MGIKNFLANQACKGQGQACKGMLPLHPSVLLYTAETKGRTLRKLGKAGDGGKRDSKNGVNRGNGNKYVRK